MDLSGAVTIEPEQAKAMVKHYSDLRHPSTEDEMILNALQASKGGKLILRLTDTLKAGGQNEKGYPNLAVMWADKKWCVLNQQGGSIEFSPRGYPPSNGRKLSFRNLFAYDTRFWSHWQVASQVPIVPPQFRPAAYKMKQWIVLWEVEEWAKAPQPPGDPALLRPLGNDLYVVEATWDLTELEKLVLAGRPLAN